MRFAHDSRGSDSEKQPLGGINERRQPQTTPMCRQFVSRSIALCRNPVVAREQRRESQMGCETRTFARRLPLSAKEPLAHERGALLPLHRITVRVALRVAFERNPVVALEQSARFCHCSAYLTHETKSRMYPTELAASGF